MLSATIIWLATLVVWPSPLPPTRVMFLPINSNSGLTLLNAFSGPPTMIVRDRALPPTPTRGGQKARTPFFFFLGKILGGERRKPTHCPPRPPPLQTRLPRRSRQT